MNAIVVRGMFERLDQYVVVMKIKMSDRWILGKRMRSERKRLIIESFKDVVIREEYNQISD